MKIQIKTRNISPVLSIAPGDNRITLDGQLVSKNGFPLQRSRTMGVVSFDDDDVPVRKDIPVIPANTVRNLLRRTMLKHVIEPQLRSQKAQMSINAYAAAYSGNSSGNPDGINPSFDEITQVRNHIFLGLFGGGPRMMEGRLRTDTMFPLHRDALAVLGEDYSEEATLTGSMTDIVWVRRDDPVEHLREDEDVQVIRDGRAEAVNWMLSGDTKGKAKKDEAVEQDNPRGLKALNAHEVVIPGVRWVWNIGADSPTNAQIGLILSAASKLGEMPFAGGHRFGYGQMEIEDIKLNGKSVWNKQTGLVGVENYLEAMQGELDVLSVEQFESFAVSHKK